MSETPTKDWWRDGRSHNGPGTEPVELLSKRIADLIRDRILLGQLAAGDRIPERRLGEELGVSRTPLREALRVLTAEGLVAHAPNRGAMVIDHSGDVILASIEFVEIAESAAGRLAASRASDDEIRHIAALTYEMRAGFDAGDRLTYYRLNREIHSAIVQASHNSVLAREHDQINARLFRIRYAANMETGLWANGMREHEQMVTALRARDGERLATILREHLSHAWRRKGFDPLQEGR